MMLKAPFPYFGGKSMIADDVWQALGDVDHYLEPFFGSGAVLLARKYDAARHTETVCDKDGYLCNVWRAIQFDPEKTARWCDWPVNHADLMARKRRLIREEEYLLTHLIDDDKWFDAELAGYWIWCASSWIGSGMISLNQRPHLIRKGKGVHAGQIPRLTAKQGVHAGQIPNIGAKGKGVHAGKISEIYAWFGALSDRLRQVRVVCGDWSRICGGDWQDANWKTVGVFFDPPYGVEDRRKNLYHKESTTVSHDVRKWAIKRGNRKNYRIVIAGYDTEHQELENHGWRVHSWKTRSGYGKPGTQGSDNAHRERLWLSPHCLHTSKTSQTTIFDFIEERA